MKLPLLLVCLLPCLLCGELKLLRDFAPSPIAQRAMDLYQEGEGSPENLESAFSLFTEAAGQGDPVAQFYAGQMLRQAQGTSLGFKRAEDYFQQAGEQGVAEAWTRIGVLYDHGKGRERDLRKAMEYYAKSYEVDPSAMCSVAYHQMEKRTWFGVPEEEDRLRQQIAVDLLKKAIAGGDPYAMNNLGYYQVQGFFDDSDPVQGMAQLQQAADAGHPKAWGNLGRYYRSGVPGVPANQEKSKEAFTMQKRLIQRELDGMIGEAVWIYERDGVDAGMARLREKFEVYVRGRIDYWQFRRAAWWEAQTRSGREDPEWAYHIFTWIHDIHPQYSDSFSEALVGNIIGAQLQTGRLGEIQRSAEEIRIGVKEESGFNLNLTPVEALNYGEPKLPDFERMETPVHYPVTGDQERDRRFANKVLTLSNGLVFSDLETVDSVTGRWREALAYAYWGAQWAEAAKISDDWPSPNLNHINEEFCRSTVSFAEGYRTLGFAAEAAEAFQKVIDLQPTSYGGRQVNISAEQLTRLQAVFDLPFTANLEDMRLIREASANNQYQTGNSPYYGDLAIAEILWRNGPKAEARELVDHVIAYAAKFAELERDALLIRIRWALEDGQIAETEADLMRALELCRQQGLKGSEPILYHFYSRLEWQQGNLQAAIELQKQSIELFRALDLYTWLPLRYGELAELYQQVGANDRAVYYASLAKRLLNQAGAQYPGWIREKTLRQINALVEPVAQGQRETADGDQGTGSARDGTGIEIVAHVSKVDLQPRALVSAPLEGQVGVGIFTLSNLTTQAQTVTLAATGHLTHMALDPETGDTLIDLDRAAQGSDTLEFTLAPEEQRFISVETLSLPPLDLMLTLHQANGPTQQSSFQVPETAAGKMAVINAALVEHNPFYAVSIFHVIQRIDDAAPVLNLRFTASAPARIEGYDHEGSLLFVDANGDGAFHSPGDLLRTDRDLNGHADIAFNGGENQQLIEISVLPLATADVDEIKIEVAHLEGKQWVVDAEDVLLLKAK